MFALSVQSLSLAVEPGGAAIRSALRAYVQSVLTNEWSFEPPGGSPRTSALLENLLHAAIHQDIARQATPATQAGRVEGVQRIASARSGRLALHDDPPDELKWSVALVLAAIARAGVAVVHLDRARPQGVALAVASIVSMLGLIAICERPFHGGHQVAPTPLVTLQRALGGG